ncbi:glycosyltransferase [Pontiella sp.]|uniref:glycosyltransferase n=1 Tax=Pontiella sp. TaxID=2837462 RepID=UPI00356169B2
MKVLCLSGITRKAGGLFYAVSSLCNALEKAGTGVCVYGRTDPYLSADAGSWDSVSLMAYKAFGPLGCSFQLRHLLSRGNGDLVHQHGIWMDDQWATLQWQKKNGRPVVISPHGMLDPWALRNSDWKKKVVGKLFANESLRMATCIHALCRSEADSIRAYGLKNPIAIIPNGVELPALTADRCLPTPRAKRKLLFLGRIHPKKGLRELIAAWSKVKSQKSEAIDDWQLIIAGWDDGGYLDGLKKQAAQMGMWSENAKHPDSRIQFLGAQFGAEKDALLRSVDAFILPSFSEGLPMSVLEAWAYRLPVVMTDFCNLPEGFEAGAAMRVEPDAESIRYGLEQLVAMPEDARLVTGERGRKLVEECFSWDRIADQMKSTYEWCLDGGTRPACVIED